MISLTMLVARLAIGKEQGHHPSTATHTELELPELSLLTTC